MNEEQLSSLIAENADRHPASDRLRAAVRTQIALHAASQIAGDNRLNSPRRWNLPWRNFLVVSSGNTATGLIGFASGIALTLGIVLTLPVVQNGGDVQADLASELITLHVHSIGVGPLFDVASSDRHTVKPWFQGKLDYAPQVPDLQDQGYELLGGRIERVDGHSTAVLEYRVRKHIISAFIFPDLRTVPPQRLQRRGFNIGHWSDGIMHVWAITDADPAEIQHFGSAWLSKASSSNRSEDR